MRQNREFTTKLDRLLELLEREGLYAVYLKRQDNFAWLTCGGINYVAVGDMGNCGLLVTLDGLHAVTTNIEAPRMREEEKLEEMGFSLHAGVWHDREFDEADVVRHLRGEAFCKGLWAGKPVRGHPETALFPDSRKR